MQADRLGEDCVWPAVCELAYAPGAAAFLGAPDALAPGEAFCVVAVAPAHLESDQAPQPMPFSQYWLRTLQT